MARKPKKTEATAQKENVFKHHRQPPNISTDKTGDIVASDEASGKAETASTVPIDSDPEPADVEDEIQADINTETTEPEEVVAKEHAERQLVEPQSRSHSTASLVFGGIIAGAVGFLAATVVPSNRNNQANPNEAAFSAALDAQSTQITELSDQVGILGNEIAEAIDADPLPLQVTELNERVEELAPRINQLGSQLELFATRLEALEARPVISVPDGGDAMAAQLDSFRSELDTMTAAAAKEIEEANARAAEIEAEAAVVEASAQRRAALAEIDIALEIGAPFANSLTKLDEVPDDLAVIAGEGAPTHASLRAAFPALARAALSTAQIAPESAGAGQRLATFLRRQTGARSLSARDGDDVDAILSRAEAMLHNRELTEALGELAALPEGARAPFADWITLAESRVAAVTAFASISEDVN
ncbi:MAG: COG4223 family protein [Boseongicola sp.]